VGGINKQPNQLLQSREQSGKALTPYDARKRTIEKWLHRFCRETINKACENVYPKFKKYNIDFPEIRYRNMISRWGSCQPKRNILTFNYQLIEAPMFCIEYVVTHEFTHFLYPNHSKLFYQQLSMFSLPLVSINRIFSPRVILLI